MNINVAKYRKYHKLNLNSERLTIHPEDCPAYAVTNFQILDACKPHLNTGEIVQNLLAGKGVSKNECKAIADLARQHCKYGHVGLVAGLLWALQGYTLKNGAKITVYNEA